MNRDAATRGPDISVAIIGIGSPFGEDQLGWHALRYLRADGGLERENASISYMELDRPGMRLLECLRDHPAVVLIDALACNDNNQQQDAIERLDANRLTRDGGKYSSHDIGVAESLALAHALNELPISLTLYGLRRGGREVFARLRNLLVKDVERLRGESHV